MTRALLLDFGNVVAFFDHRKACRRLAELSDGPLDEAETYRRIFASGLERRYDCGELTTTEFISTLRHEFKLRAPDEAIAAAWSDIFTPNPAVADLLDPLRRAGYRLVLASNTNELHLLQIRSQFADALSRFHQQVASFEIGCRKPDDAFFAACLAAAECAPDECVLIDDISAYVEAARNRGIRGIVYSPTVDLNQALFELEQNSRSPLLT